MKKSLPAFLFSAMFFAPTLLGETMILSRYRIIPEAPTAMREIATRYEVVKRRGNVFEILVPKDKRNQLLAMVPTAKLLEEDIDLPLKEALRANPNFLAGYHTFQTVVSDLKAIEQKLPGIAKLEIYGKSAEGRDLYVLKLSDNVHLDESEPELMLTSATHGDELISVEVLFGLINAIVNGYGNSERFTKMVDNHVLYFIPVVNPDGYTRRSRYTADGTDPNRDYPYPEQPMRNPDPCIQAMINFFNSRNIVGSIDYHSSGSMIMYPWAYTYDPVESQDEKRFDELTSQMASTNGYVHGPISKVIYVAKGSSADYFYWINKSLSLGIEIGHSNSPSSIQKDVQANAEAAWTFIESF